jgi:flagellar biosynthesis anti-sigma factor FlgM
MERTTNMRIDLNPGSEVEGAQSARSESGRAGAAARTPAHDQKVVSFENSVGKLAETALSSPEVRQQKVQALKAQVDAGSYQVSDRSIAGSVLEQLRVGS